MSPTLRRDAWILIAVCLLLGAGWVYGIAVNWPAIESRPVRLAYLICDAALVIPVGLAAGLGVLQRRPWALAVLPFALGALLFDTAHGVVYLIWDNFFHLPLPAAFAILGLLVIYCLLSVRNVARYRDLETR